MKVADWMNTHPLTVHPDESVATARALLEKFRINQLPVVARRRLVGTVTDRDLRAAFPPVFSAAAAAAGRGRQDVDPTRLRVSAVLTANVLTLAPNDTVPHAATLMRDERIGALPVVENEHVVGVLTRSDVLAAFLDALKGRPEALVHELFCGARTDVVQAPEGRFTNEILIPCVRRADRRVIAREIVDGEPDSAYRFVPGSEWMMVKLYAGEAVCDRVLSELVLPLTEVMRANEVKIGRAHV